LDETGSGSEAGKATNASFSFLIVADFKVYCIEPKEVPVGGGEGGNDAALEERARLDNWSYFRRDGLVGGGKYGRKRIRT
jgi:hypothetical protein